MRRSRPMAMRVSVAVVMAVTMGIGWNHRKMLYYNITTVYQRKPVGWVEPLRNPSLCRASLAACRIHTAIHEIACAAAMKRRSSVITTGPVGSCRDLGSHDGFREELNPSYELDALCALRRAGFKVVEDVGHLPDCPACAANFHRPCFAHMARTSSSVANSPRSASASEASMSVASSGVCS